MRRTAIVALALALAAPFAAASPPDFRAALSDVAASYRAWGRAERWPAWALALCDRFVDPPRESAATRGPHDHKLFFVYARDRETYLAGRPSAIGQTVVKESFAPREADRPGFDGAVRRDGHLYVPGDPIGLFVMRKLDPSTPGTDRGWIYGFVSSDGTVREAGLLDRCASCHRDAPGDRLFGLAGEDPQLVRPVGPLVGRSPER